MAVEWSPGAMHRQLKRWAAAIMIAIGLVAAPTSAQTRLQLRVLSSPRADLVSGGDALVELRGAKGPVTITVNGAPAGPLGPDAERGSFVGLVSGLRLGQNATVARAGRTTARLTIVNHSRNGPILSGPHINPYQCTTETAGLGKALDEFCNAPTKIERFYRTTGGKFEPWPASGRPLDLATLALPDGRKVPYVVRVEAGTINRTIYRIAMLDDPDTAIAPGVRPNPLWNRRLAVKFEGGLAGRYEQGFNVALQALDDIYLSRGFAVMNASALVNGRASNAVLQGETLMMLKEHFIESYGLPKWTVGTGGSGGAIQQINITSIYPGLLDGIQAEASFADSQVATHVLDCDLMENFWKGRDKSVWTDEKKAAAAGYGSAKTCQLWTRFIAPGLKVSHKPGCGLKDASLVYDPKTNPAGARCGIYNLLVNQLGRDEKTGFPLSPWDNVGVQYGLTALDSGKITVDEFLDLNEHIGGFTIDHEYTPARTAGDADALKRLYASGLVNSGGGGLKTVPIILSRKYGDPEGDFHDRQRDFEIRLRMIRANGDADNQVIWVAAPRADAKPFQPRVLELEALDTMTRWLDAIAADVAPASHAKTVRLRPADAVDAWFDAKGAKHVAPATLDPRTAFNQAYPLHGNPRIAAGGPQTNDLLKCRLKPAKLADYRVRFTAEQANRLRRIFPSGVCDFGKPGIGQVAQAGTFVRY
jgi:hypothetical protein